MIEGSECLLLCVFYWHKRFVNACHMQIKFDHKIPKKNWIYKKKSICSICLALSSQSLLYKEFLKVIKIHEKQCKHSSLQNDCKYFKKGMVTWKMIFPFQWCYCIALRSDITDMPIKAGVPNRLQYFMIHNLIK